MPTPTTGTFRALAASSNLTGSATWDFFVGADMKAVFNSITDDTNLARKAVPGNYNVVFGANAAPDTTAIILNPGTIDEETLAYASLPGGFTVTAVSIKLRLQVGIIGQGAAERPCKFYYNGAQVGDYINFTNTTIITHTHVVTPVPSTLGTFFSTNYGFNCDGSGLGGNSQFDVQAAWIEGTYEIQNFSYYIKTSNKIVGGLPTTIIDKAADIAHVLEGEEPSSDEYVFYGTSEDYPSGPIYFWWQSVNFYEYYISSPYSPDSPLSSPLSSQWTKFTNGTPAPPDAISGTVGILDVIVANASGVYVLQADKLNDTLYLRDSDEVTIDVKIPNPTVKIGVIP